MSDQMPPEQVLSAAEVALIGNYRKSDQAGRENIAEYAQRTAENWPMAKAFNALDERRHKEALAYLETLAAKFPA